MRGRNRELDSAVAAHDRRDAAGVVLLGAGGVGKTKLAAAIQQALVDAGATAVRLSATRAAASVPLGTFTPLLPALSSGPIDLVGSTRRALLEKAGDGEVVLLVDDAHLLDPTSASVLLQLVQDPKIFTVVTVRLGEPVDDSVAALWRDGFLERIDVDVLGADEMTATVHDLLPGDIDELTLARVLALAAGSPLALSELVLGAVQTGALAVTGGRWRATSKLAHSARLAELIADRLGGLSVDERNALELVALAEPIGVGPLGDLATPEAIDGLEARRLIEIRPDGRRAEVWLSHPLHGEALRAELPLRRRRALIASLADQLRATGARRRGDVLRLGTWALELGDSSDPALLIEASRQAYVAIDFDRAQALAAAAWQAEPSVAAGHLLGWLRCTLVDHDGAEIVLARAQELVGDDRERVLVAMARSENLFRRNDAAGAHAVVLAAEAACDDEVWRAELIGHRAALLMLEGHPGIAGELVAGIIAEHKEGAEVRPYVQATIPASTAASFDARPLDGLALAQGGFAAHITIWDEGMFQSDPGVHLYNSVVALTHAGQLDAADTLLDNIMMEVLAAGWGSALAALTLQQGLIAVERGRLAAAIEHLRRAVVLFDEHGPRNRRRFALAALVGVHGLLGDVAGGMAVEGELDGEADAAVGFTAAATLVARSWLAHACGQPAEAHDLLEQAYRHGLRHGERSASIEALHVMARQGRVKAVGERVAELRDVAQGDILAARLDHVEAIASGDPDELTAVGERFEAIGALLCAAEAHAAAATALRADGEPRRATAAAGRAARLAARCEGASTPALVAVEADVPLTARELEVARLAATGLTSREIATRLGVSARTVDNQLQSAYGKLGVSSRRELGPAMQRLG